MVNRRCLGLVLLLVSAPLWARPTPCPDRVTPKPMFFAAVPATVFVADGAGNFQRASRFLRAVTTRDGYPIEVITCEWSHGNRRILADQTDYAHARSEGEKLASMVQAYHAAHPEQPLYLLGHSAGTTIIIAALEHLPANVVERAVLMAPSISAYYDLLPAVKAVKHDIHVFYSSHECLYLRVGIRLVGTSDRTREPAAGVGGFRVDPDPQEPSLSSKLIQHPWQRSDRELGHNGSHFGGYQPGFLRANI